MHEFYGMCVDGFLQVAKHMCLEATDCHHVSLPAIFQCLAGPGVPHLGWTSWPASFRVPAAPE